MTPYLKRGKRHIHRLVAEEKLGRALRPGEVVHHMDGNPRNNALENIEVLPSQAEHARRHFAGVKRAPKTSCKRGHPLTAENVLITSSGKRRCLQCEREYQARWRRDQRRARGLRKPGPKPGTPGARAIAASNQRRARP